VIAERSFDVASGGCTPIRHIERHELLGGLINEYKAAA
jgi:hypothetical protein